MTKYFILPALLLLPLSLLAEELEDSVIGESTLPKYPDNVPSDTILRHTLEQELGITFTDDNSVVLLHTGKDKFAAMFSAKVTDK